MPAITQVHHQLKPLLKTYKPKTIKKKAGHILSINYEIKVSKEPKWLLLRFRYARNNKLLTFTYEVLIKDEREKVSLSKHSLSDLTDTSIFPGIKAVDLQRVAKLYTFKVEKNEIVSTSKLDDQVDAIVSLIKNNMLSLIDYAISVEKKETK